MLLRAALLSAAFFVSPASAARRSSVVAAAPPRAAAPPSAVWTAPSAFTCWDPSTRHICLPDWTIGHGNASFSLVCTPPKGSKLQWCGIGFNTVYPSPRAWGMAPSEIIMLVPHPDGSVSLEDRAAAAPGLPPCFKKQLTTLTSAHVDPASGALSARFSRPVFLTQELLDLGYTNLNRTVPTVAAAGWSHAQVAGVCDTTLAYHDIQYNNASIAFL
jgi:hypothetical protein